MYCRRRFLVLIAGVSMALWAKSMSWHSTRLMADARMPPKSPSAMSAQTPGSTFKMVSMARLKYLPDHLFPAKRR